MKSASILLILLACLLISWFADTTILIAGCEKGDANGDSKVNLIDIIYLVNYFFKNGNPPFPLADGDVNCAGSVDLEDIVYLVNYIFKGGPKPCSPAPEPEIVFPEDSSVISDIGLIIAEQRNKFLSPFCVDTVRFEYSIDGITWTQIWEETDLTSDLEGDFLDIWDARWDVKHLSSGQYLVRATMKTFDGQRGLSSIITIIVNKLPYGFASVTRGSQRTSVIFDGTLSNDSDGTIMSWKWYFGDGSVDSGSTVEHMYPDSIGVYDVSLTVEDNLGAVSTAYYILGFTPSDTTGDTLEFIQDTTVKCQCIKCELRGDADDFSSKEECEAAGGTWDGTKCTIKVLGPKGDGSESWGPQDGKHDGKTLGPLHDNPIDVSTKEKCEAAGGTWDGTKCTLPAEKKFTGYAFEVVCEVKGVPSKCEEIQVRKSTWVDMGRTKKACEDLGGVWNDANKTCIRHGEWKGKKADLNKDGTYDIVVDTKEKCEAAGGKWDGSKCTLEFPQGGTEFGPDTPEDTDPGGAYESEYAYKKHTDNKIVWWDAPRFDDRRTNSSTYTGEFIAIIRDSDGNYCCVAFKIELHKKAGKDDEKLTQTGLG